MNKMMSANDRSGLEIAVIGMAGRFPGARNIDEFWNNLKNGVESITFFLDEELEAAGIEPEALKNPNYVKAKAVLEDIEYFDAPFFEYTPREAEIMNPQLKIFHECSWEALEDAGYDPDSYDGLIGLYVGASSTLYWEGLVLLSGKGEALGYLAAGNLMNKDFLSTIISYKLNLKGPSSIVQTACSTSLVAIHWACRAVLSGECNIALAGGVAISLPQKSGYFYQEGMIQSRDGHCRAFDARAKGAIAGNAAGVVVLKRLKNAIAEGDNIYAIVKGSAINNDGNRKVGFTAPSVKGQAEVIRTALAVARVEPGSIGYFETHGTGTVLGDLIEIQALKLAFNTNKKGGCPIGSVKTNVGHLDVAAGVTGFIKTVLALNHRLIPPTLHFENPNPEINFENSPVYINTQLCQWENVHYPLRAAVSSFGIGGTNAHVILEEAPTTPIKVSPPGRSREYQLILLSAKTSTAMDKMTKNLVEHFKKNPGMNLADTAYTLQVGRKAFEYRKMFVCSTVNEAIDILSSNDHRRLYTSFIKHNNRFVIFMFSGLGSQYVNMGLDLYRTEPIFRDTMDQCFKMLKSLICWNIKEIFYPHHSLSELNKVNEDTTGDPPLNINQAEVAQVFIFIFEYALARLLIHWGIKPDAMIGYSFGEYAAACVAGVFSLEDALKLVVFRGQLIKKIPTGVMFSVPLTREEVEPLMSDDLSLAIDNGPSCIVAGPNNAVDAFEKRMKKKKILGMRLQTSYAVHSKMMEPILKEFEEKVCQVELKKPQIPYISNVTGKWITITDALAPGYWARHLRKTVQFAAGMKELLKEEKALLVEIGPGQDLKALVMRYINTNSDNQVINLVRHPQRNISDVSFLLNKIGTLWLYGAKVDWRGFYSEDKRRRIILPPYPFERQRYWIDGDRNLLMDGAEMVKKNAKLNRIPDIADWCYLPTWKRSILDSNSSKIKKTYPKCRWLVFVDELNPGDLLEKQLKKEQPDVVFVKRGDTFKQVKRAGNGCIYTINPKECSHYHALFNELRVSDTLPDKIIHLWGASKKNDLVLGGESFEEAQYLGFYSLIFLTQAIAKQNFTRDIYLSVVTHYAQEVIGGEPLRPEKSTVLGLLKVIPQEYPGIRCTGIDIDLPEPGSPQEAALIDALLEEFTANSIDTVIAYRNNRRWVQIFEPLHLERPSGELPGLREKGVYLITGGLGRIGLIFSELLVKHVRGRLILTGRSYFPANKEWDQWLEMHDESDPVSLKIKKLQQLEEMGGEVRYFQADTAGLEQMQEVIGKAEKIFGEINGVIHSAGIVRDQYMRPIRELSPDSCRLHFQTKVYGTLVLKELFENKKLDFCWMLSSISCILGGLGFGAYASANFFMDIFVKKQDRFTHSPWFSLGWDGMDAGKSAALYERIFQLKKIDHLVVSRGGNLQARIEKWIKLESVRNEGYSKVEKPSTFHPRPNLSNAYVPPGNSCEQAIVNIWQNLLGFDEIGIQDDFLELGGDSLKAITMISRIHQQLNVNVSVPEFFAKPTIERLTEYILNTGEKIRYIPIESAEQKEIYPLSSAQRRLYIVQQTELDNISYNMTYVMVVENELDKKRLEETVRKLIERHGSLRTSFEIVDDEPVQKIHKNVDFVIEYHNQKDRRVEKIIRDFVRPFDLSRAPLLRMGLIELPHIPTALRSHPSQEVKEEKHLLLLDMHHIISDGVSLEITVRDFMLLYAGEKLIPLKLQYKDYSEWENSESARFAIKQQEQYWLNELAGEIPELNLPYDYVRPTIQSFEGDIVDFQIDENGTTILENLALKEDITLFMLLLAIYNVLLFKLSGQEDIIVGTGVAGRRHEELHQIIGLFVNTLPLRNYPVGSKTFKSFLNEVKEKTLLVYENQECQFDEIVKKVVPNRKLSRNPLCDTVIVLQNVDMGGNRENTHQLSLPGLILKPYEYTNKISKFDISLICTRVEKGLYFMVEYCTKLFKQETIKRFIAYFKEVLAQVLENSDVKLEDITISHQFLSARSMKPEMELNI